MMSGIRGKNTRPEIAVRRYLHARGFRFRLHRRDLPGKPDIVLPKYRTAIFVHGCYWHRHEGCKYATTPSTNREFWQQKFHENVERDRRHQAQLADAGWNVLVIWECRIDEEHLDQLGRKIIAGTN
jgi:DNA mismatch endonuclease (patch repair protein)